MGSRIMIYETEGGFCHTTRVNVVKKVAVIHRG